MARELVMKIWLLPLLALGSCTLFASNDDKEGGSSEVLAKGKITCPIITTSALQSTDSLDVFVQKYDGQNWHTFAQGRIAPSRTTIQLDSLPIGAWISIFSKNQKWAGAWNSKISSSPVVGLWESSKSQLPDSLANMFPPSWKSVQAIGRWQDLNGQLWSFSTTETPQKAIPAQLIPIRDGILSFAQSWSLPTLQLGLNHQMPNNDNLIVKIALRYLHNTGETQLVRFGQVGALIVNSNQLYWKDAQSKIPLGSWQINSWSRLQFKFKRDTLEFERDSTGLHHVPYSIGIFDTLTMGGGADTVQLSWIQVLTQQDIPLRQEVYQEYSWWLTTLDQCDQEVCIAKGKWKWDLPKEYWAKWMK